MWSAEPHRAEPTGAPRPFEKQTLTVSKWAAQASAGMPVATAALKMREPSRWRASPLSAAHSQISATTSNG